MIIHCVFATEYCARCSKHRADQLFGCTRLQFRGVGPIWLIRELPCTNLHVEKIVSKVIIIAFHHLHVSKIPKKRRKNKENILFFSPKPGFRQSWTKVLGNLLQYAYFSVISPFPLKTVHFRNFLALPPPPTLYKVETRKKFWIHPSNIVCGVRGGVGPE